MSAPQEGSEILTHIFIYRCVKGQAELDRIVVDDLDLAHRCADGCEEVLDAGRV